MRYTIREKDARRIIYGKGAVSLPQLSDSIQYLRGIGPAKAKQFQALGIQTIEDLICHFPRAYEDRTQLVPIASLEVDQPACFRAMVVSSPRTSFIRKGLEITKATVADHSARLNLTFFNQRHSAEQLQYGAEYIFYGAVSGDFIGYAMTNPIFERPDEAPLMTRRILPIYPLTAGLSNKTVAKAVLQALSDCGAPPEVLPESVRTQYGILEARAAYRAIHQPRDQQELEQARRRLAFEEFFLFSAGLSLMRARRTRQMVPPYRNLDLSAFLQALPFSPTGGQRAAMEDILHDFARGVPMNRLVQGDVGSGKTVVAAAAAYCAVKNGSQAALMAPTEILAEQHYRFLSGLFIPLGVRCALLTGSLPAAEKRQVRALAKSGQADLLIGTHALLTQATAFRKLGLVITDEQHRFGVSQRAALSEKGEDTHLLVMSATPIPRTLSLILYGDLEVSSIRELPPGRQKIDTFLIQEALRPRLNAFLRKQVTAGRQCYIVCPAVEEGEVESGKAAQVWAETLQKTIFPDLRVGLLHGRMKGTEKEAVMQAFSLGDYQILVATTVIEVGVDVPNATVIVVEDADRFGLSQLHQLRGRVGRGREKSYCILISNSRNPDTLTRLRTLCQTSDGFRIAEEDLRLRGPGDFLGRRQHGLPSFRSAGLCWDLALLHKAQEAAVHWFESQEAQTDSLESRALWRRVRALFQNDSVALN